MEKVQESKQAAERALRNFSNLNSLLQESSLLSSTLNMNKLKLKQGVPFRKLVDHFKLKIIIHSV